MRPSSCKKTVFCGCHGAALVHKNKWGRAEQGSIQLTGQVDSCQPSKLRLVTIVTINGNGLAVQTVDSFKRTIPINTCHMLGYCVTLYYDRGLQDTAMCKSPPVTVTLC